MKITKPIIIIKSFSDRRNDNSNDGSISNKHNSNNGIKNGNRDELQKEQHGKEKKFDFNKKLLR